MSAPSAEGSHAKRRRSQFSALRLVVSVFASQSLDDALTRSCGRNIVYKFGIAAIVIHYDFIQLIQFLFSIWIHSHKFRNIAQHQSLKLMKLYIWDEILLVYKLPKFLLQTCHLVIILELERLLISWEIIRQGIEIEHCRK